ncbi:DUF2917 domain-containing protein [Chitinimonas sp. PSY-7]|uniref:DUF2917 domain-containing protein n=1 Tax=Chitinimonas sp. PSY-7 TaxID=3459088 RepID=UPI00403FFFBB
MFNKNFIKYEQSLQRNQLYALHSNQCVCITCRKGDAWITEANGIDIILLTNEQYQTQCNGLVIIEALSDVQLQLQTIPTRRTWLARMGNATQKRLRYLFHAAPH